MQAGRGDRRREVKRVKPETEENAQAVIDTVITPFNPEDTFGRLSDDVSFLSLASVVKIGQLGTTPDTVRCSTILIEGIELPL